MGYEVEFYDGSIVIETMQSQPDGEIDICKSNWHNVSALDNIHFRITGDNGSIVAIRLYGFLQAQASNDSFVVSVQGMQGNKRNNVRFTIRINEGGI